MTKKKSLADLVQQEVKRPELQTSSLRKSVNTEVSQSRSAVVPDSQIPKVPKYLTLVRKDARLRDDQLDLLTSIARRLNRQRQKKGERITENTLIRVAVDLLLDMEEQLEGINEDELLKSVKQPIKD